VPVSKLFQCRHKRQWKKQRCVNVLEDVETVGGNWKHALMDYENHTDTTPFQHGSHTDDENCDGASEFDPDTCPDSAKHSSGDSR
jgi:hypothetical protein